MNTKEPKPILRHVTGIAAAAACMAIVGTFAYAAANRQKPAMGSVGMSPAGEEVPVSDMDDDLGIVTEEEIAAQNTEYPLFEELDAEKRTKHTPIGDIMLDLVEYTENGSMTVYYTFKPAKQYDEAEIPMATLRVTPLFTDAEGNMYFLPKEQSETHFLLSSSSAPDEDGICHLVTVFDPLNTAYYDHYDEDGITSCTSDNPEPVLWKDVVIDLNLNAVIITDGGREWEPDIASMFDEDVLDKWENMADNEIPAWKFSVVTLQERDNHLTTKAPIDEDETTHTEISDAYGTEVEPDDSDDALDEASVPEPFLSESSKEPLNDPIIGIQITEISPAMSQTYGIPAGVYIRDVEAGSAGEKAGLQQGDVITAANGQAVETVDQLVAAKESCKKGDTLTLTIFRDNKAMEIKVQL